MSAILTFTPNPAVDVSTSVDRVVAERKLRCAAPRFDPGGGGINVARVIQRLGGDAMALYPAGGPTGELLQALLRAEGVPQHAVPSSAWTRQNVSVQETTAERQFRFVMPGQLTTAEWADLLEQIRHRDPAPRFIVASGSLPPGVPPDGFAQIARLAAELGSKLVLDTSGLPLVQAVQAGVYLVKPNVRELAELAGTPITDDSHMEQVAESIVARGLSKIVLVSLGAGGAFVSTATEHFRMASPLVHVRSKVGAGDSLTGAIVLALARGRPLRDAVRFAVSAGAAAVMQPGTELCHAQDVMRLYEFGAYPPVQPGAHAPNPSAAIGGRAGNTRPVASVAETATSSLLAPPAR